MKRQLTTEKPTPIKAPKSPRSIENDLADMIEFMVSQMAQRFKNQVIGGLHVSTVNKFADEATNADDLQTLARYKFADVQTGNFASILLRLSKLAGKSILKQFSNGRIDAMTQKALGKLDKKSKEEFYKRVAAKTGINVADLIAKEGMRSTTNALMAETGQWIKTLRDETFQKFTNNTLFAMSQGESLDNIVSQFDGIVSDRKNHAKFLARNQVQNYNSVTTKIRAQNLGITNAVWETAGDERVRPSHEDRDGKEFDLAQGLYSSQDGLYLLPGTDYNCFPGDSQLNHTSLVHKLYRRRYSGELVSLVFNDGVVLKTTPNHPVLTAEGFKAAHLIKVGDEVIRRLNKGLDSTELYGNRPVPTFEQIYAALNLLGVEQGVAPAISGKFHGDVNDSEVEIIAFDSLMMREADTSIRQKLGELGFTVADQVAVLASLTCNRDAIAVFRSMGLSTESIISALNLCSALINRHLTPLECFRFALGTWGEPLLNKPGSDGVAADSKKFGDCIFALSVLVYGRELLNRKMYSCDVKRIANSDKYKLFKMTLDGGVTNTNLFTGLAGGSGGIYLTYRVVDKISSNFDGYIYNLQTDTGDYVTNTVAVSNCRCTYTMIIPETVDSEDE